MVQILQSFLSAFLILHIFPSSSSLPNSPPCESGFLQGDDCISICPAGSIAYKGKCETLSSPKQNLINQDDYATSFPLKPIQTLNYGLFFKSFTSLILNSNIVRLSHQCQNFYIFAIKPGQTLRLLN